MIIDCHGHYNTERDFIRTSKRYGKYEYEKKMLESITPFFKSFEEASTAEAWVESLDRYGVDKVVLQTAPIGGNDSVAEFIRKAGSVSDRFVGLANIDMIDPEGSNSVQELDRCVNELGLKGIGELYPMVGPWDPGNEKCFPVYEKAQELGIPIMLHFGTERDAFFHDERYGDPYMLDPALRAFPSLIFIVCHMAQDFVANLFTLMHVRRNLYAEISSCGARVPTPAFKLFDIDPKNIMKKFLDKGFADRLLWATDVQAPYFSGVQPGKVTGTIKENYVVKLLEELNVSEEDKAKIMGENAKRVFRL